MYMNCIRNLVERASVGVFVYTRHQLILRKHNTCKNVRTTIWTRCNTRYCLFVLRVLATEQRCCPLGS